MFYDVTFEPMKIPTLSASQSWYHIKNSQLYESDLLIGCSFKTEMISTNHIKYGADMIRNLSKLIYV